MVVAAEAADFKVKRLVMRGHVWRARWVVTAILLCTRPADAVADSLMVQVAQNIPGADRNGADANRAGTDAPRRAAPNMPEALPVNSPEQIRKAQTELQRLDCLKGRVDGKLGNQTRQAVKKFWTSAGQPVVEVSITDELIAELAERGAGFCRPARRFFAIGPRPSGNSSQPPFFFRGARPSPVPGTPTRP